MSSINEALLRQARKSGVLNLSNRGLSTVPETVWSLHKCTGQDSSAAFDSENRWWDSVQLTKLNLSSNEISSLSEGIGNFPSLTVLDLHDNKLNDLPPAFSGLQNLKRIDLSHNSLTTLQRFDSSTKVVALLLQHNKLNNLLFVESTEDSFACELLDVSHNLLTNLSPFINQMVNLRSLNLSNNCLQSLPELANLKSLKVLNLNNNKIRLLSNCFENLLCLEQLHLRNNFLEDLPSLSSCEKLLELYVGNNNLKACPKQMPQSITILELRDNKIPGISNDIALMCNLERLDIANNDISRLPPELGELGKIKVLVIDGNPLRAIRRDIVNRGTQAILKHLRSKLTPESGPQKASSILPQSDKTSELQRMHALSVSGKFVVAAKSVSELEKQLDEASQIALREISITSCSLEALPNQLLVFKNSLAILNLSLNKITELSSNIAVLSSLTHLNICNNRLSSLPAEMRNLKSLQELNISNNRFAELPEILNELTSLEHLFADGNQIKLINMACLQNLSKLATVSFQNNSIGKVPPELSLLKALQTLKLEGNVFRVPRQSIVQKGSAAVIEYLRSRIEI